MTCRLFAGYEWIGWRNDTPGWSGHPLEILFEFDKVRNFSAANLHTNNFFTRDVQVNHYLYLPFRFIVSPLNGLISEGVNIQSNSKASDPYGGYSW